MPSIDSLGLSVLVRKKRESSVSLDCFLEKLCNAWGGSLVNLSGNKFFVPSSIITNLTNTCRNILLKSWTSKMHKWFYEFMTFNSTVVKALFLSTTLQIATCHMNCSPVTVYQLRFVCLCFGTQISIEQIGLALTGQISCYRFQGHFYPD